MSTSVIPQVICSLVLLNVSAKSETVKDTVKKSKASQDQPMKPTAKNSHCWVFSMASSLNGLATLSLAGLRVVIRVAAYFAGDMWRCEYSASSSLYERAAGMVPLGGSAMMSLAEL